MNADERVWRSSYPVRTDEIGIGGAAAATALLSYMQDAAAQHARALGFSLGRLAQDGLSWVLVRMRIRFVRFPAWGECVQVETWPSRIERLLARRDFLLRGAAGEELARATSNWLMMRLSNRRPARLPQDFLGIVLPDRPPALDPAPEELSRDFHAEEAFGVQTRLSDCDVNRHVNHIRYVEWMLEAVPPDLRQGRQLAEMDVGFRAESVFGDAIDCKRGSADSGEVLHLLQRRSDGKALALGRSTWV